MEKHLTASAYIVYKINGKSKVLLHIHRKWKHWLGFGGHVEKNENPQQAIIREVKEESNLNIKLLLQKKKFLKDKHRRELSAPFTMLEIKIPKRKKEKAHCHIDFVYFATATEISSLKVEEKYGWFSKEELKAMKLEQDVAYAAFSAIEFFEGSQEYEKH